MVIEKETLQHNLTELQSKPCFNVVACQDTNSSESPSIIDELKREISLLKIENMALAGGAANATEEVCEEMLLSCKEEITNLSSNFWDVKEEKDNLTALSRDLMKDGARCHSIVNDIEGKLAFASMGLKNCTKREQKLQKARNAQRVDIDKLRDTITELQKKLSLFVFVFLLLLGLIAATKSDIFFQNRALELTLQDVLTFSDPSPPQSIVAPSSLNEEPSYGWYEDENIIFNGKETDRDSSFAWFQDVPPAVNGEEGSEDNYWF